MARKSGKWEEAASNNFLRYARVHKKNLTQK